MLLGMRWWFNSKRKRHRGEADVEADVARADARDTGGVPNPEAPDQASTTGTSPNPGFVGRVAGDDPGYVGETGAERRSEARAGRHRRHDDPS